MILAHPHGDAIDLGEGGPVLQAERLEDERPGGGAREAAAERDAGLRARHVHDEGGLLDPLAVEVAVDREPQFGQRKPVELKVTRIAPLEGDGPELLALIFPNRFDDAVTLGDAVRQRADRVEQVRVLEELVHGVDDGRRIALRRLDGRRDALDGETARLHLRGIVQVALLHLLGEGEIVAGIAQRGLLEDPRETFRRQAGGHAVHLRVANAHDGGCGNFLRQPLRRDGKPVRPHEPYHSARPPVLSEKMLSDPPSRSETGM
ncbi:Uncharacterised protein [Starkeya nomas]|uniref:Uncharacterized protein n=1 Tax=Starkeya nomas TaxID=2666134 RepID=A0A5S9R3G1_9HYPH|nr:Uncharacterised protein [Starkeya nomas]